MSLREDVLKVLSQAGKPISVREVLRRVGAV